MHGRVELELDALGYKVFDQEGGLRDRAGLGIGMHLRAPGAGHGSAREGEGGGAAALALVGQRHARMLDAVGAREDDGDRHRCGLGGGVAHQGGQMHLLAWAVDAAVGVGESIDRAGRVAALDAAIGQIEGGSGEVEEGVVAIAASRRQARPEPARLRRA